MVLGFRTKWGRSDRPTNFVEKILNRIKIHTLREDLPNRWKANNSIQMVTGNRTKQRHQFHETLCSGTQIVHMTLKGKPGWQYIVVLIGQTFLYVGDYRLECAVSKLFVRNDGFDSADDFLAWFVPIIEAKPHKLLTLKLIHWTDYRY
jgi:hypothetical protein